MKAKIYITALAVFAAIALSAGTLVVSNSEEFLEKRAILVVREIGHQLLLHAGDSTSRVLPVKKLDAHTFQLEFQSQFSFFPDTLVKIIHQRLGNAQLPLDYMVNVFNCSSGDIIFGYEVRTQNNSIMPCLGRGQPVGCYKIQIAFTGTYGLPKSVNFWWILGGILIGGILFSLFNKKNIQQQKQPEPVEETPSITIGKYAFYPERSLLMNEKEQVELSDKETKILSIFATNQNQVVERDRLLKEVWEDEGVFVVGRSLDVFVSKLRKKLQGDEAVKISNVHGKGYKLEVAG